MPTHYAPLPLHEQIVRKKSLPSWWDQRITWNNTSNDPPIIKSDPRWSQLSVSQGIPICLRENGPLTVIGIAIITGYKMHSIYNTIYKLAIKKIVGYSGEQGKNGRKLWCILDGMEPFISLAPGYVGHRSGMSKRIRALLRKTPWQTSAAIAMKVDATTASTRDAINRMVRTGELVRRKISHPIGHTQFEYAFAENVTVRDNQPLALEG